MTGSVGGGFLSRPSIWAYTVYLTMPTVKDSIPRQPGVTCGEARELEERAGVVEKT